MQASRHHTMSKLLLFPNEVLDIILEFLEYGSEVNAVSQTCVRLRDVADAHLYAHYAKTYSPRGLIRMINNNDPEALQKLLSAGIWIHSASFGALECPQTAVYQATKAGPQMLRIVLDHIAASTSDPSYATHLPEIWNTVAARVKGGLKDVSNDSYVEIMNVFFEKLALASRQALQDHLFDAVGRGVLSVVKSLVEDLGADVNWHQSENKSRMTVRTPINVAAENGHLDVVEYLLETGIDLDLPLHVDAGLSPLVAAALHGHTQVEKTLIDHGAHLGSPEDLDLFYLIETIFEMGGGVPNLLLKMVDITPFVASKDEEKRACALYWAILSGNETLLFQILQDGPLENHDFARTAVCVAAEREQASMTKTLFEMLAEPMEAREVEMIKYNPKLLLPLLEDHIIKSGLSQSGSGERPENRVLLDSVCCPEVSTYFLDRGLGYFSEPLEIRHEISEAFSSEDQNFKSLEGILRHVTYSPFDEFSKGLGRKTYQKNSVLQIAASAPSFEKFTKYLELTGLNLDPMNDACCQALANAVENTLPETVRYFVDKGFDVNRTYWIHSEIMPPLRRKTRDAQLLYLAVHEFSFHSVCKGTREEKYERLTSVLRALIDHGAELDATGPDGRTALALAIEKEHYPACQLLIERGANPMLGFEEDTSAIQGIIAAGSQKWRPFQDRVCSELISTAETLFKSLSHEMTLSEYFLRSIVKHGQDLVSMCECEECSTTKDIDHKAPSFHWSRFFVVKAMRQRYWRAQFPVPGLGA